MTTYKRSEINDEIITKSLSDAIQDSTPDILQSLRAELNLDTADNRADHKEYRPVKAKADASVRTSARTRAVAYKVASCAAALIVLIGGASMVNRVGPAFAVVGLDVNPGIEMTIDKNEKVISAVAVNEEGQHILSDLKIEKSNVNSACDEIVEAMMDEGYLTDTTNSVLLSVRAEDPDRGREIEKEISENLNGFLEESEISPAIFGQYVEDDDQLDEFAGTHGISIGKAWLIRKLTDERDLDVTEDSLLGLSTQELVLLGQDRKVSTGTSIGTPDTSKYVGTDSALIAALEAAGLSKEDAENVKVNFSCENGSIVYSVGFDANSCIYGFNVDALTGMVMLHDNSVIPGVSAESPAGNSEASDNATGSSGVQNTAAESSQQKNSTGGSGSDGKDPVVSEPGDITGETQDITDTDPDEEPGDISGDVEDIDDMDGKDCSGSGDPKEQGSDNAGSGSSDTAKEPVKDTGEDEQAYKSDSGSDS